MKRSLITQQIEKDILAREPVWNEMQMLFMDTEPDLVMIARVCADSKYSLDELREILFFEILPALQFNLLTLPGGEWRGFKMSWLKQRILKKHTRGRFFQPFILRGYTRDYWQDLKTMIENYRSNRL